MIDVALTPAGLRPARLVVVIDVLRATSTIAQALAAGYAKVLCTDSVERAALMRAPGRVLAGERRCVAPAGFDQGNSPLDAMRCDGRELILATTNGTPTIVAATRGGSRVLLACLLNLDAVRRALVDAAGLSGFDLQIVCSGTGGAPALEDTYLAGLLCAALPGPRTDAALIVEAVSCRYPTPSDALAASAQAAVLRAAGLAEDISHCALESKLEVVPRVLEATGGIAAIGAAPRRTPVQASVRDRAAL
ncbi:MAG TPA: 2-phosphosulfolactate phosphatase [Solirubrobacteraceae bacterium]